jgi:hypothetical protein
MGRSALLLLMIGGCAHLTIDPSVHQRQRFALVAFYGQETIPTPVGTVGSFSQNRWGWKVAEKLIAEVRERLEKTLGHELVGVDGLAASATYAGLPLATFGSHKASPAPLRAISNDAKNDAALGRLATELGADAVILIANTWLMLDDGRQYAQNGMELVIVGADGKRLWDEKVILESARAELTGKQLGAEMLGVAWEETAVSLTREAVLRCLERFASEWRGG